MSTKIFLTINAVLAVLYGLGFVLFPASSLAVYGVAPEPHVILNIQFFGSALLGIGVIEWFAKDFRDWDAVRGVLIANVVADVVGGLVNLWGTFQGLLNAMAWSSTIVYVLLLAGALYCLSMGPSKQA
jgi:hypothetical protein